MDLSPELPDLAALRDRLVDGLAAALRAGAPKALDDAQTRAAAEHVIDGRGLPDPIAQLFDDRPVCTLVGFDADGIQSWVFDSERVQVASGASYVLDELNQQVDDVVGKHGIHGVLYSAGGGGMLFAKVPADHDALVAATRDWLEKRSHELRFTVIAEDLRVADLAPPTPGVTLPAAGPLALDRFQAVDGIRGALVRLQVAMRAAKDAQPRPISQRLEIQGGARSPCAASRNPHQGERGVSCSTSAVTFARHMLRWHMLRCGPFAKEIKWPCPRSSPSFF